MTPTARRFPPPWSIEDIGAAFVVKIKGEHGDRLCSPVLDRLGQELELKTASNNSHLISPIRNHHPLNKLLRPQVTLQCSSPVSSQWSHHSQSWLRFGPEGEVDRKAQVTTTASVGFIEPNWGEAESMDLVVSVSCIDCTVEPSWQELTLPRSGDSKKIDFWIKSRVAGNREFTVRVYLAKQMIQLQSLRFSITVAPAQPAEIMQ